MRGSSFPGALRQSHGLEIGTIRAEQRNPCGTDSDLNPRKNRRRALCQKWVKVGHCLLTLRAEFPGEERIRALLRRLAEMQNFGHGLIEMVQSRAPFRKAVRLPETDRVIFQPLPAHDQQILV